MSQSPTSSHSVQLVTAKYLETTDVVAGSPATPRARPIRRKTSPLLIVMRLTMVMLLAASIPLVVYGNKPEALASFASQSDCGINWLLSIFGSEKSFEERLSSAIDSANRDVERQLKAQERASEFPHGKLGG